METQIQVIDRVYTYVTREGDPEDRWDRDSTGESHDIQGIRVVDENDYFDLTVDFEVVDDRDYYLLYGIYSTGDSFGHDEGRIQFVDLYESREVAEENAKRLRKHNDGDSDDGYTATLVTEEGKDHEFYVPWKRYFERLSYLEVEPVRVGASRF